MRFQAIWFDCYTSVRTCIYSTSPRCLLHIFFLPFSHTPLSISVLSLLLSLASLILSLFPFQFLQRLFYKDHLCGENEAGCLPLLLIFAFWSWLVFVCRREIWSLHETVQPPFNRSSSCKFWTILSLFDFSRWQLWAVSILGTKHEQPWIASSMFFIRPILFQVVYACREYACRVVDILARRTRLAFLNVHAAEEALPRIVEIMAGELNWDKKRIQVSPQLQ